MAAILYLGRSVNVIAFFFRLNFSTAFSTNATSICHSVGLKAVERVECSTCYAIEVTPSAGGDAVSAKHEQAVVLSLHDRMTQCRYTEPVQTFRLQGKPEAVYEIDIMGQGRQALEKANKDLG